MRRLAALVLGAIVAGPVASEPVPLRDLIDGLSGREVSLTGTIGYMEDAELNLFVRWEGILIKAQLDAGRETRSSISGCQIFEWEEGLNCQISANAEIRFADNELLLNVYEISELKAREQ